VLYAVGSNGMHMQQKPTCCVASKAARMNEQFDTKD